MDFGRSFTFMTEDPQWINKLLIAGVMLLAGVLLSFIIVGIVPLLIFAGYMVELLQNTASGNPQPLPEWNDFGTKLMKGLHVAAIGIVYALPLILFACCQFVLGIAIGGAKGGTNAQPNETLATLSTLVGLCFGCFAAVYGIVLAVVTPAAITQYAVTGQLPAAFRFSEVIAYIRNNASNYIVAILLGIVAGFVAQFGIIACVIGLFVTAPWAQFVQYHLYGEVYRHSVGAAPPATSAYPPPAPAM